MSFHLDEWTWIDTRGAWDLDTLLRPHNEHLSLGLALVYKALLSTVGLSSYLPYLAVLLALHVATAAGIYQILSRTSGPLIALAGAVLMLFLGTGSENLYWAFQIGFVGSTAAGVWSLAFLRRPDPPGLAIAASLLVVSVVTQGIGLTFVAAGVVYTLLTRRAAPRLLAILPAVVIYAAWYLAIGRNAISHHRNPFTFEAVSQVPGFVVTGASHTLGSIIGAGDLVGTVLLTLIVLGVIWRLVNGRLVAPMAVAALAGLFAQFGIIGLVRAQFGLDQATSSRYVYVSAPLALLMLTAVHIRRRRARRAWVQHAIGAILLALALATNAVAFVGLRGQLEEVARHNRAVAAVVTRYADAPGIDHDEILFPMPSPMRLRELFATYGDITTDALFPELVPPPTPEELDAALARVLRPQLRFAPASPPSVPSAVRILDSEGLSLTVDEGCAAIDAIGPNPALILSVPDGATLLYRGDEAGEVHLSVARHGALPAGTAIRSATLAGQWYAVPAPILQDGRAWIYRLAVPASVDATRLCVDG